MIYGQILSFGRNIYDDFQKDICWFFGYITVADLLQFPGVKGKPFQFSDKGNMWHWLDLQFWHLFKNAELTEIVKINDKLFINLLNKVRVGNIDCRKIFQGMIYI